MESSFDCIAQTINKEFVEFPQTLIPDLGREPWHFTQCFSAKDPTFSLNVWQVSALSSISSRTLISISAQAGCSQDMVSMKQHTTAFFSGHEFAWKACWMMKMSPWQNVLHCHGGGLFVFNVYLFVPWLISSGCARLLFRYQSQIKIDRLLIWSLMCCINNEESYRDVNAWLMWFGVDQR